MKIQFDTHVTDDVLKLIFTACHPVLTRDGRVALTLKLVGGLSTEQVARAFLVPTPDYGGPDHPGEEGPRGRPRRFRGAGRPGAGRPVRLRPRGRVPDLQRGLRGDIGGLLVPGRSCATRRCAWVGCCRPWAPEEPEAHGLVALMEILGLPHPRPQRPLGAARRSRCSSRTAPAGTGCSSPTAWPPWPRRWRAHRQRGKASQARTSSRPSLPPATPGRAPPPTPTGRRIVAAL